MDGGLHDLITTIRHNCSVSDARDSGVFSMCTLFLRLRNLYKWEQGLEPWQEEAPPVLLDWIDSREAAWGPLAGAGFAALPLACGAVDPFAVTEVAAALAGHSPRLIYGAGYGRSMKAVFFVGERIEERRLAGIPVHICGRELARELASPFALLQDDRIVFRRDPYRYHLWDWIQEGAAGGRLALRHALGHYRLLRADATVDRERLRREFDAMVDAEMEAVLHHEVGEMQPSPLGRGDFQRLIETFPASPMELVVRAVKDLLADTHEMGMLGHIIAQRKVSSLAFYAATLDGMRRHLAGELVGACNQFFTDRNWRLLDKNRRRCRDVCLDLAARLAELAAALPALPEEGRARRARAILHPLGLTDGDSIPTAGDD
ncbi:MAG: Sfum_1244 family protein [Thermodesulfobacteriota bacterium]